MSYGCLRFPFVWMSCWMAFWMPFWMAWTSPLTLNQLCSILYSIVGILLFFPLGNKQKKPLGSNQRNYVGVLWGYILVTIQYIHLTAYVYFDTTVPHVHVTNLASVELLGIATWGFTPVWLPVAGRVNGLEDQVDSWGHFWCITVRSIFIMIDPSTPTTTCVLFANVHFGYAISNMVYNSFHLNSYLKDDWWYLKVVALPNLLPCARWFVPINQFMTPPSHIFYLKSTGK